MAQTAEGEGRHALAVACLAEASDHPARHDLANEVHARPFLRITAPARVTHLAVLGEPAADPAQHLQLVNEFCLALGISPPVPGARHLAYNGDGFTLKWERHTEFSTFTVVGSGRPDEPFAEWIDGNHHLPAVWRMLVDGKRLVALQIEVLKGEPARKARRERSRWFGDSGQVGSRVLGGGEVWCDWQIGDDGFSRFLVLDLDFRENQVGRLVQRLAEIETYRLMALLSLPVAREMLGQLENLETRLGEVIWGMAEDHSSGGDAERLLSLTELAGQVEALSAEQGFMKWAGNIRWA